MRPSFRSQPVPSASLLRFLRNQAEEPCFFTSNSGPIARKNLRRGGIQHGFNAGFPGSTRKLTTSPLRQANVELGDFDFLRPATLQSNILGSCIRPNSSLPSSDISIYPRHASTDSRPLLKRLLGRKSRTVSPELKISDLPPLPSFLDEVGGTSLARSKAGKSGSELKLRCTEIDANGNVTTVNGEFKKSELIAKVSEDTF